MESQRPQFDLLIRHGKTVEILAGKFRSDPHARTEALNEIKILQVGGGKIMKRCVVSREYHAKLTEALGLADATPTPSSDS